MARPGRTHMATLVLALIAAVGGSLGCAREPDRLWQKMGNYTMEDYKRFGPDKAACTRKGKLDVACMRSRGWIEVSGKRPAPKEAEEPAGRPTTGSGY